MVVDQERLRVAFKGDVCGRDSAMKSDSECALAGLLEKKHSTTKLCGV